MEIKEIVVSAGRTFNHPFESYSNLKPQLTLKATLAEGDDVDMAVRELQAKAESLVEDHKRIMLRQLEELHELTIKQQEVAKLEQQIRIAQNRLDDMRRTTGRVALEALEPDPAF